MNATFTETQKSFTILNSDNEMTVTGEERE